MNQNPKQAYTKKLSGDLSSDTNNWETEERSLCKQSLKQFLNSAFYSPVLSNTSKNQQKFDFLNTSKFSADELSDENKSNFEFFDSQISPELSSPIESIDQTIDNITTKKYINESKVNQKKPFKFKEKEQFKITNNCIVCQIPFPQLSMKIKNQCRVCGYSVCMECSEHKIKEHTLCDLCYTRHIWRNRESRRKRYLKDLGNLTDKLTEKLILTTNQINFIEKELTNIQNEKWENYQKMQDIIRKYEIEQKEAEEFCKKQNDNNQRFKKVLAENKDIFDLKKKRVQNLKNEIKNIEDALNINEPKLEEKSEILLTLQRRREKLEKSESFVRLEHLVSMRDSQFKQRRSFGRSYFIQKSETMSLLSQLNRQENGRSESYSSRLDPFVKNEKIQNQTFYDPPMRTKKGNLFCC